MRDQDFARRVLRAADALDEQIDRLAVVLIHRRYVAGDVGIVRRSLGRVGL